VFQGRAARLLKHCQTPDRARETDGIQIDTRWYRTDSTDRTVQLGDHNESSGSFSLSQTSHLLEYSPRPTLVMPCPSHTIPIPIHLVITLPTPNAHTHSHPVPSCCLPAASYRGYGLPLRRLAGAAARRGSLPQRPRECRMQPTSLPGRLQTDGSCVTPYMGLAGGARVFGAARDAYHVRLYHVLVYHVHISSWPKPPPRFPTPISD
jgi:hypothetical protein